VRENFEPWMFSGGPDLPENRGLPRCAMSLDVAQHAPAFALAYVAGPGASGFPLDGRIFQLPFQLGESFAPAYDLPSVVGDLSRIGGLPYQPLQVFDCLNNVEAFFLWAKRHAPPFPRVGARYMWLLRTKLVGLSKPVTCQNRQSTLSRVSPRQIVVITHHKRALLWE